MGCQRAPPSHARFYDRPLHPEKTLRRDVGHPLARPRGHRAAPPRALPRPRHHRLAPRRHAPQPRLARVRSLLPRETRLRLPPAPPRRLRRRLLLARLPLHATSPKTHAAFWRKKIAANRTRDRRVTRTLRTMGWRVRRIWPHELARPNAPRLRPSFSLPVPVIVLLTPARAETAAPLPNHDDRAQKTGG